MMIRWDIVPPGQGDSDQVERERDRNRILSNDVIPHLEERPRSATEQEGVQRNPLPPKASPAPKKAAQKAGKKK